MDVPQSLFVDPCGLDLYQHGMVVAGKNPVRRTECFGSVTVINVFWGVAKMEEKTIGGILRDFGVLGVKVAFEFRQGFLLIATPGSIEGI